MKVYTMRISAKHFCVKLCTCHCLSHTSCILSFSLFCCVNLRGQIKEAAWTLRKQDPTLPGNRALSRCECFKQVWILQLTQHNFACTWTVQDTWSITTWHRIYAEAARQRNRSSPRTPHTVLNRSICKFLGSAFWTLFRLNCLFLSLIQRTAML